MKSMLYIIFISIVFCQTSSLSMYGFGEYINSFDASSVALGDSKYFGEYELVCETISYLESIYNK